MNYGDYLVTNWVLENWVIRGYQKAFWSAATKSFTYEHPVWVDWLPDGTKVERPATDEEISRFWSSWMPAEKVCRCADNAEKFILEGCTCPKETK